MSKPNILGSVLINTGVPASVLKFAERNLPKFAPAHYVKNSENRQLPIAKQINFCEKSHKILSENPLRVMLYSHDNIQCARSVALRIYLNFLNNACQPFWHLPSDEFGIKQDELLRELRIKPNIPLIVLDNINVYMSQTKTEKVSRILSLAGCPVLIIISGKRPYNYIIEHLNCTPDFILRAELESKRGDVANKSERV